MKREVEILSYAWKCTLERMRQKNNCKFNASLGYYTVSCRPT